MANRSPVGTGVLIALSVIGILLFLWLLAQVGTIVAIALLAIVLATGIAPLADRITRAKLPPGGWNLPRGLAILLVYLGLVIVVLAVTGLVGSVVVREAIILGENAPRYLSAIRDAFIDLQQRFTFLPDLADVVERAEQQIGAVSSYASKAIGKLVSFVGNVLVVIVVFVLAYYLMMEQRGIKEGFLRLIPPPHREKYGDAFAEMGAKMGGWLRGQLLLAFIVGATISIFLWIIGVPYALIIGVIGAVAEIVPMVGPAAAAVPAVLLVIFQPPWQIIAVIGFFIVLSQVEGNYLGPRIMKQQVGLSPLVTILALLVGAALAGAIGALLAIPLAAAVQVFVQRIVIPAIEESGE